MKNGSTKYLTEKQHSKICMEYNKNRVKKDMADKYKISMPTLLNVIANGRCSERVYSIIFG